MSVGFPANARSRFGLCFPQPSLALRARFLTRYLLLATRYYSSFIFSAFSAAISMLPT